MFFSHLETVKQSGGDHHQLFTRENCVQVDRVGLRFIDIFVKLRAPKKKTR